MGRDASRPTTADGGVVNVQRWAAGVGAFLVLVIGTGVCVVAAGALAGVGLEGHHQLMHQRFVVVAAEHGLGGVHLGRGLTLLVQEFELH